jgi:hypothetical protein
MHKQLGMHHIALPYGPPGEGSPACGTPRFSASNVVRVRGNPLQQSVEVQWSQAPGPILAVATCLCPTCHHRPFHTAAVNALSTVCVLLSHMAGTLVQALEPPHHPWCSKTREQPAAGKTVSESGREALRHTARDVQRPGGGPAGGEAVTCLVHKSHIGGHLSRFLFLNLHTYSLQNLASARCCSHPLLHCACITTIPGSCPQQHAWRSGAWQRPIYHRRPCRSCQGMANEGADIGGSLPPAQLQHQARGCCDGSGMFRSQPGTSCPPCWR